MKQVFQDLHHGTTSVEDVPVPQVPPGHLLIRSAASLISAGTERMLAEFGRGSYLDKARQQPEKVRQVVDKARTDGIAETVDAVRAKLAEPLPMGYANAGYVEALGAGVTDFQVRDLVASNGPHAEYIVVPTTLAARADDQAGMTPERAAFATVGAISLQSVRLTAPTLGERFVVLGLGLVGLLTVQALRASGCQVLGADFDESRVELAEMFGARGHRLALGDPIDAAVEFTAGNGADGVIVAAATSSSDPVHQAALMSRKRGRIVLVGVTGLELRRADFYEKELSFQVSCSYGPGRHDPVYEQQARDYPLPYVRWTSARNQQAVLEMIGEGRLNVDPLVSHRFPLADAPKAYEALLGERSSLGIVLEYPAASTSRKDRTVEIVSESPREAMRSAIPWIPRIGFIGAGAFTQRVLLPALSEMDGELRIVASQSGASAATAARRFGFRNATSDVGAVLESDEVDVVFITTRHDTHAELAARAISAGKHVFLEKPMAIDDTQLTTLVEAYRRSRRMDSPLLLMVGFNRRFAPQIQEMVRSLQGRGPKSMTITVNAGTVEPSSWLHDPAVGGGRIIGEACHFIDLLRFLAGTSITETHATVMAPGGSEDTACIQLSFSDGSIGTINYFANGHAGLPKERLEVFCQGRVLQLENFRRLRGLGANQLKHRRLLRQDKGHKAELERFLGAVSRGEGPPIAFEELLEVTKASFRASGLIPQKSAREVQ